MCLASANKSISHRKMKTKESRGIKAIVNIIKKLQSSSGTKREGFISKVKKQFNLDDQERSVITKLRMILFRMEADIDILQICSKTQSKNVKLKSSQTETILMKAQRLKAKKKELLAGNVRKMHKINDRKGATDAPHNISENTRKPRQRLEEKQLAKLRTVEYDDDNSKPSCTRKDGFHSSKLEFMRSLNLVPNIVCL